MNIPKGLTPDEVADYIKKNSKKSETVTKSVTPKEKIIKKDKETADEQY
jgi:hypothetical protein